MDESRKKLYDALSSDFDLGKFEDFSKALDDSTKARKIYDQVSSTHDLGDFNTFYSKVGKAQPTVAPDIFRQAKQGFESARSGAQDLQSQGIAQGYSGNPFAGITNLITGKIREGLSPLAAIPPFLQGMSGLDKSIVEKPGEFMAGIGRSAMGGLYDLATSDKPTPFVPQFPRGENYAANKEAAQNFGGEIAPFVLPELVKGGMSGIGKLVPESLPEQLAARAGKFTGTPEQILKKGQIALREKINPANLGAMDKLNEIVGQLDNDIGAVAKHSDVIKTDNMMKFIEPLVDKVKRSQLLPQEAESQIRGIVEDTYNQRGEAIPADVAHDIKKGIYKENKAAYDQQRLTGKLPGVDVKAQMKIASGILDEWKTLYPETDPLLKRQSDLLSIQSDVSKSVRREMVKSNLPNSLLLAFSPKWWLTKMIASNPTLEYNLGRILYRARGGTETPNPFISSGEQPYDRISNPAVSEGGGRYRYTKGDYVFFDEPSGSTIAVPKAGISADVVKNRIKQYNDAKSTPSPYPDVMKQLGRE